ncbi:MAG TPA: carbon-nitrogen hydrolase family protein, partial [Candidatus Lambdaproteobacteria bacterium]|nr:carbon-nitrogen hydrolase family protein [Candidatus Lambdaproteobacteria bacterium]
DGGADSGFINVNINLEEVDSARSRIPSLSHDKSFEF